MAAWFMSGLQRGLVMPRLLTSTGSAASRQDAWSSLAASTSATCRSQVHVRNRIRDHVQTISLSCSSMLTQIYRSARVAWQTFGSIAWRLTGGQSSRPPPPRRGAILRRGAAAWHPLHGRMHANSIHSRCSPSAQPPAARGRTRLRFYVHDNGLCVLVCNSPSRFLNILQL